MLRASWVRRSAWIAAGLSLPSFWFMPFVAASGASSREPGREPSATQDRAPGPQRLGDDLGFADAVLDFDCGPGGGGDPRAALAPRDDAPEFALGQGGSISVEFHDNDLTVSGDPLADLVLVGRFDAVSVAVRAADPDTERALRAIARADDDGFVELGTFTGNPVAIDLDALLGARWRGEHRLSAVRVRDRISAASASPSPVLLRPAVVRGVFAASIGVLPIDVVSREVSLRVRTASQSIDPVDVVGREVSLRVRTPSEQEDAVDVVSREVSLRVRTPGADSQPVDVVSREVSLRVRTPALDAPAPDVVSREVSLFMPFGPDLRVVSIVAPASGETDEPVHVDWLVRNSGNDPTSEAWVERVSFSTDGSPAGIVASHDTRSTGGLAVNSNRTFALDVPAPSTPGSYWVIVDTDATDLVDEGYAAYAESNNRLVSSAPIDVTQSPRPALEVVGLTPPADAAPSQTVEVVWTTRNSGTAVAVAPWTERIVLAQDSAGTNPQVLWTQSTPTSLGIGESAQRSVNVVLPAVLPPDPWLIVCTNVGSELILLPGTITCATARICPTCPRPDLRAIVVSAPSDGTAGEPLAVEWNVRNDGVGPAIAPWFDRASLVRESDGVVVATATYSHSADLAEATERVAAASIAVPIDATGPYRVRVQVDAGLQVIEPNGEANNTTQAGAPTTIGQPPRPDLVPTSLALSDPTPTTNEVIAVTWNVTNSGNAPAAGPWQDGIYFSSQSTFSTATAQLRATYTNSFPLTRGASYPSAITRSVAMPSTPGTYYLYAFTDRFDDAEEGLNEGNNVALIGSVAVSYPPRPNLAISSLVPAASGPAGTLVDVSWTVTNDGEVGINAGSSGPTNVQWNERIYASSDAFVGGDLLLASNVYGDALAVGAFASRTRSVPVPPLPAGYYLVVEVDPTNVIQETNEADNFRIARDPSFVALPNLVTSNVTNPPAATADANVNVEWTVTNASAEAIANGPWLDSVFIRPAGTSGVQPLGSLPRNSPLAPGASYTASLLVAIPGTSNGANEIYVVSDSGNVVAEGVSTDNTGFGPAIAITQPPRPNLVVDSIELPGADLVQRPFTAMWRLRNTGAATANAPFTDRVYAVHAATGTEYVVGFATITTPIAAGDTLDVSAPATMPPSSGTYRLAVVTDRTNAVNEGIFGGENDNRTTTAGTFNAESFVVTASTPISAAPTPSVVPIDGVATTSVGGLPAANVNIDVAVDVRGTRRVVQATTGAGGTFSAEFRPLPGEGGAYELRAGPRDQVSPTVTDDFELYAVRAEPSSRSLIVYPGFRPTSTAFVLRNAGDVPLNGVQVNVSSLPSGVSVQPTLAATDIGPLGTLLVDVLVEAAAGTATQTVPVTLSFSTNQGATTSALLDLAIRPPAATIVAAQSPLRASMELPGPDGITKQTLVQMELRNLGSGATQPVNVLPPSISWLSLATSMPLDPLLPGESTTVTFILRPATGDVPAGATATGQIAVTGGSATTFVPFEFRAFLPGEGTIRVLTADEGTYWGLDGQPLTNGPRVADATVTVREHFTQVVVGSATTTATGEVEFVNLAPGYYDIRTSAPGHATNTITRLLSAGETYERLAFMPIVGVTYTWNVVPTEIEDQYVISVNTTFQTDVPTPVITIDPPYVDLDAYAAQSGGQPFQIDYTITNHGLIRADDVRFTPTPATGYSLTAMATELGDLAAQQSVVVPVIVTPVSGLGPGGCSAENRIKLEWTVVCGVPVPYFTFAVVHSSTICPPPGPPSGGCGGFGGGAGGGSGGGGDGSIYIPPPPSTSGITCECIENITSAVIGCVASNPCASFVFDCARPAINYVTGGNPDVSLGDVLDCAMNGAECLAQAAPGPVLLKEALLCACNSGKAILECYGSATGGGGTLGGCLGFGDIPCSAGGLVDLATKAIFDPECSFGLSGPRATGASWQGFLGTSNEPPKQYWITSTERLIAVTAAQSYPYGNLRWSEVSQNEAAVLQTWLLEFETLAQPASEQGVRISPNERESLILLARPAALSEDDVSRFLSRWNRTEQYWGAGIYTTTQLPDGFDADFIDLAVMSSVWNAAWDSIESAQAEGFLSVFEAWQFADDVLDQDLYGPQAGVCATVEVQIDQTVAVTRSAFRASLGLDNASESPLDIVDVDLRIETLDGTDAAQLFAVRTESLTGIAAFDGTASLPPASNASATWLLIPSSTAAPTVPVRYSVSGSLSFVRNGVFTLLPLAPIGIEVLPNADLKFKYFIERDVFSDDPFTTVIEPSVPFDLGLRVENEGAGSASNLTITSAQPEIVSNESGLFIDFQIIGSQVGTLPGSPSLTANMGNFGPGVTNSARWRMTSSLQGKFIGFDATVQNLNGLDDPEFWIIDPVVDVKPMLRSVRADDGDDDGLLDFLGIDPNNLVEARPDRLWTSLGTDEPVDHQFDLNATPIPGATLRAQLSATVNPSSWTYLRINDPFNGQYALTGVQRGDGKTLQLGPNAWQTDRYLTNGPSVPAPRIHLFDRGGDGNYTLFFDADVTAPRITTWASYSAYGAQGFYPLRIASLTSGVDSRIGGPLALRATFDERVDSATFTAANVLVTANVGNQLIGRRIAISTHLVNDGTVGEIVLLSAIPDRSRLCVQLTGVKDLAGNLLSPHPAKLSLAVLVGDVTNDGAVTNDDLALVELLQGTSPIDPGSIDELRCDIDRNGAIDAADRALVEAQLGRDLVGVPTACLSPVPGGG